MTPVLGVKRGFHLSATSSIKQEWYLLPRQVDLHVEGITNVSSFLKVRLLRKKQVLSIHLPVCLPTYHLFIHLSIHSSISVDFYYYKVLQQEGLWPKKQLAYLIDIHKVTQPLVAGVSRITLSATGSLNQNWTGLATQFQKHQHWASWEWRRDSGFDCCQKVNVTTIHICTVLPVRIYFFFLKFGYVFLSLSIVFHLN